MGSKNKKFVRVDPACKSVRGEQLSEQLYAVIAGAVAVPVTHLYGAGVAGNVAAGGCRIKPPLGITPFSWDPRQSFGRLSGINITLLFRK